MDAAGSMRHGLGKAVARDDTSLTLGALGGIGAGWRSGRAGTGSPSISGHGFCVE